VQGLAESIGAVPLIADPGDAFPVPAGLREKLNMDSIPIYR
jgi:hypothetical protein